MTATTSATLAAAAELYAPAQHAQPAVHDFRRFSGKSPRGFKFSNKRKLDEYEEQAVEESSAAGMIMDDGDASAKKLVAASTSAVTPTLARSPAAKRAKHNVAGVGKASGRGAWKEPGIRAGSIKSQTLSTSWEHKMRLKKEREVFKEAKQQALDARKSVARSRRLQCEAAAARREAGKARSSVTQTITKSSTLQRMMKSRKQRKTLRKADTVKGGGGV
jgi:hypothetical protein